MPEPASQASTDTVSLNPRKTLYLIDSSIYIFRAWHTLPDSIQSSDGTPVNALYGFVDFLLQIHQQTKANYLVCAFDKSLATSARNDIYPPYKANRDPAPEDLKKQFALCQQVVTLIGYHEFAHPRYEADDIIGTLAKSASKQKFASCIISADKDLTQFVGEQDIYWNYARKLKMDASAVEKRFGVKPQQIADMLAISGDKVDNIPGIPGVGMATAAKLLKKWNTLENLFKHADDVAQMKFRGAARVSKLLSDHKQEVLLSRQLTGLLPVEGLPTVMDDLKRQPADADKLVQFFKHQGYSDKRQQQLVKAFCT